MRIAWLVVFLAVTVGAFPVADRTAQEQDATAPAEPNGTFSGAVVELTADRVTVSRSAANGHVERHTFLLKPETRIEGKLKTKARVTVGFNNTDEGDVARLIVVRQPKKP